MALAPEDIEQIKLLIQDNLSERLLAQTANVRYELDLREKRVGVLFLDVVLFLADLHLAIFASYIL